MKQIRTSRRVLRGTMAAMAVVCAALVGHQLVFADQGLSSSIDVFINKPVSTNQTLGLSIFSQNGAVPPTLPVGVESNVVLSQVQGQFPDISSVRTFLGGDVDLQNIAVNGAAQTKNATAVDGTLADADYLAVLDARLLTFEEPAVTRGVLSPVLTASDFIRTVAAASGYYSSPARGVVSGINREIGEIGIDVDIFNLSDIDDDENGIPNATDLLAIPEAIIVTSNGNITAILPLDGSVRGASGVTFSQSIDTSTGPINVDVTAPLLSDLQAADAGFNAFDTGRLILTVSRNAASTLDGPDGVDPIGEFDTMIGPAPQNVFVRASIAVTDSTATPVVWTFVDTLPGTTRIEVELSGPGIGDLLTDGMEIGFYTYAVTGNQSGENITYNGDEMGWEETLTLVLSDQNAPAVRTATASAGDDTITATSDAGTAIWGTSAVSRVVVPGSGGGSSGCFIATAAYGTPLNAEIDALRAVRDRYMLNNPIGSLFANAYYRLSPPIAEEVSASGPLQVVVRTLVAPLVALSKLLLASPALVALGAIAVGAGATLALRRRRQRA